MGSFASINARIVPLEQACVSILDNGFTFGDSVYETLRTYRGRPFLPGRHLARLRYSASRLEIAIPRSDRELAADLDALLARAANPESYIRLIVSRGVGDISYHFERVKGPTIVMAAKPFEPFPEAHETEGVALALVSVRRNAPDALDPAIKSCNLLNSVLAVREAQARGCYEGIMLNRHDEVTEGASSNVFAVKHGVVRTPPLAAGILPGITREVVLAVGREAGVDMREQTLRAADLAGADELFITSTIKEVAPATRLDGRPVGSGRPGPVTLRLRDAFRAFTARPEATAHP